VVRHNAKRTEKAIAQEERDPQMSPIARLQRLKEIMDELRALTDWKET
jgi:hypothetical protein